MSGSQLSPYIFLSEDFRFTKDTKNRYLMQGVRLAILSNVIFMFFGFFIRIDLSILAGLILLPCLIAWILLKKNLYEIALHTMSAGYALGFIISPWLIGPIYSPILVYIFILFVANLVFHSRLVKILYFLATFLSAYAYTLSNINSTKPVLPYIEFVELGMLIFIMMFMARALNIFVLDIKGFKHQLREREIFLDNIINTSPNAVFVKNNKRQFVLVNNKFIEIDNRPRETYLGKTAVEIQGDFESEKRLKTEDHQILTGEKQIITNIVTAIKDEQRVWFEYSKVPVKDEHKNIVGILGVTKNITQKKLQEIALKEKNEQLKKYIESNMQLENFAHIASHDLREPIRSIVSFSQLLQRKAKEKLDKDESEYLEFIIDASKNMTTLINDLLAYATVDSKQQIFEKLELDLLLESCFLQMRTIIEEKQATISYDNMPENIYANSTQIKQLFQNLIANGIKFNRSDVPPVITIRAKEVGHYWQFSVSDNGIGINPEYHEKIFLIFRRLHTRDTYEGSGIGLATCRKIVDLHQGKIWLESEKGQGTTFHFTIRKKMEAATKIVGSPMPNDIPQTS